MKALKGDIYIFASNNINHEETTHWRSSAIPGGSKL